MDHAAADAPPEGSYAALRDSVSKTGHREMHLLRLNRMVIRPSEGENLGRRVLSENRQAVSGTHDVQPPQLAGAIHRSSSGRSRANGECRRWRAASQRDLATD